MEKEFVPYELALRMKALGFYFDCFGDYFKFDNQDPFLVTDDDRHRIEEDNEGENIIRVPAPTFSQAFRWFREEYDLHHVIHQFNFKKDTDEEYLAEVDKIENGFEYFRTYEECEHFCLKKLIEIVEETE